MLVDGGKRTKGRSLQRKGQPVSEKRRLRCRSLFNACYLEPGGEGPTAVNTGGTEQRSFQKKKAYPNLQKDRAPSAPILGNENVPNVHDVKTSGRHRNLGKRGHEG